MPDFKAIPLSLLALQGFMYEVRSIESSNDTTNLLNLALEDVLFMFTKVREEELVLADKLKSTLRHTREALGDNFDQQDPKFITFLTSYMN